MWRIWNFDTNEYPNIFVLKKTIRTNVRIYSYQKKDTNMIRTNIRGGKYSNIFEYPNIQHTMIWKIWYERISEYIRIKKWYERIYEYIRIEKIIRIWYERIFVSENTRIYSNIRIFVTLWLKMSRIAISCHILLDLAKVPLWLCPIALSAPEKNKWTVLESGS